MNPISSYLSSSIGRKWIVALTGLGLFGFVVGHMIGNLQVFIGPEPLNRYGHFLQGLGELLWVVRLGLLAMLVAHVVFTIKLRLENRAARGTPYAVTTRRAATLPARMMALSGLMVLCFIVFHLLHFTAQKIDPSFLALHDDKGRHDVYRMMILGFQSKAASGFYVVAVGLLAMHLNHGIGSLFQTLGLNSAKVRPLWEKGGVAFSWLIFLGYASIPVAVLTGVLK
ncbi:MAG: succinate dehydrogenase cytochrome b subunit [Chthoniobacter sp.]|nr:succinate dehydrogenase cytochrome b subunit [Chthoniobacter sp.]